MKRIDIHTLKQPVEASSSLILQSATLTGGSGKDKKRHNRLGGTVVQQVNSLLKKAIEDGASDIHIEPGESDLRVRFRVDGVLHLFDYLAIHQKEALISRIKILAGLDIAEKRRPQDGRIRYKHQGKSIDLRVSTLPVEFGEKVVLRILDKGVLSLKLESLGFSAEEQQQVQQTLQLPYGMILVTGPTGSGKTTTLYAALNELNTSAVNITTIEDPIEYNLAGVNQTRVRSDIGFTFAQALRAFLRQDPNVIMVGEMRDSETVEIALRAALTGHLVLSTLHTNNAPATIIRLIEMGVASFLVGASVKLVIAQRLVRRICKLCKVKYELDSQATNLIKQQLGVTQLWRGKGCKQCKGTGYRGRIALFELMPVTSKIAASISKQVSLSALYDLAISEGMRPLHIAAKEKVTAGITTLDEVLRETGASCL